MTRFNRYTLIVGMIAAMILSTGAFAAENPCNPCGGETTNPCNPCNPCSGMKHFGINDPGGRDVLTFDSKAPLEKIVGTTNKIMGHVQVNPKDITKGLKAAFALDLASLKTGIDKRDEHMRDNFLETAKYPEAMLTIDKVTKASDNMLMDGKTLTVDAEGTLSLHGVKNAVQLKDITVTYFDESEATKGKMPGDLLIINGGFSLNLPDYNIEVPQFIFLKLAETIKVSVDLTGSTATKGVVSNPCNPCAGVNPCNPCNPCAGANPCNPCGQ
jgi:polyisoprenoid-binding protein YceI